MADGSMEPIGEDGPNVPDDFASEPIKKSDAVILAYLKAPDAPENAVIKAIGWRIPGSIRRRKAGDVLPISCP